jgi:hypothetical protein
LSICSQTGLKSQRCLVDDDRLDLAVALQPVQFLDVYVVELLAAGPGGLVLIQVPLQVLQLASDVYPEVNVIFLWK